MEWRNFATIDIFDVFNSVFSIFWFETRNLSCFSVLCVLSLCPTGYCYTANGAIHFCVCSRLSWFYVLHFAENVMMCDSSRSLQYSWISPCKGYTSGINGPETTKSPLTVNVIHAESTDFIQAPSVMSSTPPISNINVPVAPEPPSLAQPSQGCRGPKSTESAQPEEQEGTFENRHSSRCRPEDSDLIPQDPASGYQPRAWANP